MPLGNQRVDQVRANEASGSSNTYLHVFFLPGRFDALADGVGDQAIPARMGVFLINETIFDMICHK
ncbi:hypothetical protein [Nocardia sp. NPDC004123]